ncbi:hypothetical protein [Planomonospora sp. ID82291]|uniref:hypothetical protein n=1 Tax=Planomonospora sp. ID82291 TaxID=2738136 RepID=UPI0018C3C280|nr:hypothetical protein [Planomonospora sp. ID82291]MBG0818196.1 hypothetical protein [Planomonospora sp. ID82291]
MTTQPEQEFPATSAAWLRMAAAFAHLDDEGLGMVHELARWSRANLPPALVALVDVLDAARGLSLAMLADRHGSTVEKLSREIELTLTEGGGSDG